MSCFVEWHGIVIVSLSHHRSSHRLISFVVMPCFSTVFSYAVSSAPCSWWEASCFSSSAVHHVYFLVSIWGTVKFHSPLFSILFSKHLHTVHVLFRLSIVLQQASSPLFRSQSSSWGMVDLVGGQADMSMDPVIRSRRCGQPQGHTHSTCTTTQAQGSSYNALRG